MKSNRSFPHLFLILFLGIGLISCTGQDAKNITPIKKAGGGTTEGDGSFKPDQKAEAAAFKDKVLVTLDKKNSRLVSATADVVHFGAKLAVNGRPLSDPWYTTLNMTVGDPAETAAAPDYLSLSNLKLSLSLTAQRIKKTGKTGDLGYLVLAYELDKLAEEASQAKKSLQLVILDLNFKRPNSKAILKTEVIYPIPDNFNLEEWVDKQTKQP